MNNHKVFVTDVLNNQTLKKAIGMKADQIVCNEVSLNNETKPDIKILNAEINRIEGTWEAYKFNRPVINSLLSKKNKNFKIDSISLKEALAKILYWTNVRTGALKFTCDAIPEPKTIINDIAFLPGSYWKALIKYFIILTKNNRLYFKRKPVLTTFKSISEIGILVNDEFELNLYQDVIVALGSKPFALFHYGNINFSNINFLSDNIELFDLSLVVNHPIQWPFNPFSVSKNELIASNLIYSNWQMLGSEIKRYGLIKASGIKKLLLNGAENIPERNLMAEAFSGSVKVYNTMNGMR